jgi:hypothetical protein
MTECLFLNDHQKTKHNGRDEAFGHDCLLARQFLFSDSVRCL